MGLLDRVKKIRKKTTVAVERSSRGVQKKVFKKHDTATTNRIPTKPTTDRSS